jgi:hypothetical protein
MAPFWHQRKYFWLTAAYQRLIGGVMARETGVGASTAVQCFPNADAEAGFLGDDADFPDSPDRQAGSILALEPVEAACGLVTTAFSQMVSTSAVTNL